MNCVQCGNLVSGSSCEKCGTPVGGVQVVPQQPVMQQPVVPVAPVAPVAPVQQVQPQPVPVQQPVAPVQQAVVEPQVMAQQPVAPVAPVAPVQQPVAPVVPVQQPVAPVAPTDGNNGVVVIKRKNSFVGIAINIDLTLDGYPYKISNDQTMSFTLTPGVHTITYKVWCRRLKTVQINAVPGGNYFIEFTPDWLWGGFKLSKNSRIQ